MTDSILESTKKNLSIAADDTTFDSTIVMHINSVLNTLHDLGIGPAEGFMIEGESEEWEEFLDDEILLNSAKSYIYLKVRLLFDPPATSFHINSLENLAKEEEWRLNTRREALAWVPPVR
jgi:hypothetical protein